MTRALTFALLLLAGTARAQVTLTPIATGLAGPVFVTNAGDGSGRFFFIEQAGVVKVRSAVGAVTTFLDIRSRVLSGGERGLLGLCFKPASNGRQLYLFYTRQPDGALTIAEFTTATGTTERVLLTVPHPGQSNHNGGCLAFGPDGGLFVGTGDGGGANDPGNNSQNPNSLLGKILRINVDTGAVEVYALGLRNPWRFSFDRATGQLWCGDVGQDSREEVNLIVRGGNYGWRIREGTACTGTDPALCNKAGLTGPVTEYLHSGGRCSITWGGVYRGSRGTFPAGALIYGDYCSGEIFQYRSGSQSVILDTSQNITSFGEDETGEIYVVGQGGTVSRLTSSSPTPTPTPTPAPSPSPTPTPAACTFSVPTGTALFGAAGGTGSVAVGTTPICRWRAATGASWLHVTGGASGVGSGSVSYSVDANTSTGARTGTLTVAGKVVAVQQSGAPPPPGSGPVIGGSGRYVPPSGRRP